MWDHRNLTDVTVLRKPDQDAGKLINKLKEIIENKYRVKINTYWDFHKWSIDNIAEFWSELWEFFGIICSKKFEKVIDLNVPMSESPRWFEGALLNYAENLLKYRDEQVALILAGEDRKPEKVTYAEMYEEAELYAAAFRKVGLKKDDIVVCYMSNRKEAVFAMEAVVSIGAIWTGALPLLGSKAVLNRFQQVQPKFLITVDRFLQQGEEIQMLENVKVISEGMVTGFKGGLPLLEKVIIVPSNSESRLKDISAIKNSCFLDEFLQMGKAKDGSIPPMKFEQVSFSHPIFIAYTSGTTGLPKPIVHGSGALLQQSRTLSLHSDASRDSIWFSVSPVGWLSWNMYCTLLFCGFTVILYEGVPFYLSPTYFWDLVDEFKITHTFIPSSVVDEFQKRDYVPTKQHSLSSLKVLVSAGSVVKPQNYDFVYEKVKKDVMFSSGYGCTELMGLCLVLETTLPINRGELQVAGLGTDIQTVDDTGKSVFGEVGEFVLSKPIPSLMLGLWGDLDGSAYSENYFSKHPGKFSIGDYGIMNNVTKGFVVCCRSDETLKQRGCRFGSSEIYNVVETFTDVRDSLCVSQYNNKLDERAVLFLKIRTGHTFSQQLVSEIRAAIARELTVRHIPDVILETKDIPYNMNGKKMEIVVKKIINNMPFNPETISNPESLKNYFNVPALQGF